MPPHCTGAAHAPFTPPTPSPPTQCTLWGRASSGMLRGTAGVPRVGRRGASTHLLQEMSCSAPRLHPAPMSESGSLLPPSLGTVPPHPADPRSHPRDLGSRETEAAPGTSHGEMGHHKCPLQLGGHQTEIAQHQGKGNGKHPRACLGGQGAGGMGCVRAALLAPQPRWQRVGWRGADGGHLPEVMRGALPAAKRPA